MTGGRTHAGDTGDAATRTEAILERCRELGFAAAGVAPAAPSSRAAELEAWLAAGHHGTMGWMADHVTLRTDPAALVPGARSVLCVTDRYHDGRRDSVDPASGRGRIARYARGDDYHRVMKRRLHELCDELLRQHPDEVFRACVDTAPILEREHAARAGLGAIGKHTLLLEPGLGSWLLLGEIVTTLDLEPTRGRSVSAAASDSNSDPATFALAASTGGSLLEAPADACGSCTACLDACPTDCLDPWSIDASRCISYLTIEHRGRIDPDRHAAIGDWLFGCDACIEACPHGRATRRGRRQPRHEAYAPRTDGFDVLEVLAWTEDDRRAAFTRSSMKRAKLSMMQRNALIVAGNAIVAGASEPLATRLRAAIDRAALTPPSDTDPDGLVAVTAQDVQVRLGAADRGRDEAPHR